MIIRMQMIISTHLFVLFDFSVRSTVMCHLKYKKSVLPNLLLASKLKQRNLFLPVIDLTNYLFSF